MNAEIKAKWLVALRSGDYAQGSIFLKRRVCGVTRHCCLGVLAEVMQEQFEESIECSLLHGSSASLVPGVREKCGLEFRAQTELMNLNDINKAPFTEIADWIEVNL